MTTVADLVVTVVNHLLGTETGRGSVWRHSPDSLSVSRAGRCASTCRLLTRGWFGPSLTAETPLVEIRFSNEALTEILADPAKAFSAAQLSGSAQFAEALAFVFRNLRWDYEADLARLFGDIAAHRLAGGLRDGLSWQRDTLARIGANAAEFVTEEAAIVTPRRDVSRFGADVDALRDDLAGSRSVSPGSPRNPDRKLKAKERAAEAALSVV